MNDSPLGAADGLLDEVDEQLLGSVADLYAALDPVPIDLVDRLRFQLTMASLEAELAELTTHELAGVRGEETDSVTFTCGSLSIMITTVASARHVRVDGWVTAPDADVVAVAEGLTREARADAQGRFVIDELPRGRVHFTVNRDGYRPVVTPSIEL